MCSVLRVVSSSEHLAPPLCFLLKRICFQRNGHSSFVDLAGRPVRPASCADRSFGGCSEGDAPLMEGSARCRPTPTLPSTRKPLPAPVLVHHAKRSASSSLHCALLLLSLLALLGLSVLVAMSARVLQPFDVQPESSSSRPPSERMQPSPELPIAELDTSTQPPCVNVASIGRSACLPKRLLFVGGLQRSGTSTLAALLDGLPGVSGLHFDPLNRSHMEAAPWKRLVDVHTGTWMKWAYFKEVVSTGGAEGKLLQHVFPYRYAVWDAKFAKPSALLAHPSALSPLVNNVSREDLWAQWRRFWTTPATTLVDKSPENILMAPFLQAMFGKSRTSFVFVMRHPLCWALVAAKWGCNWQPLAEQGEGATAKAPALECIEHLMEVWLVVHEQLVKQMPDLSDRHLLPAESDIWLREPTWLALLAQRGGIGGSLPSDVARGWSTTQTGFREASHGYVHCFLRGFAPRRTRVVDSDCQTRGVMQVRHAARMAWLRRLDHRIGSRVRALGYTMNLTRVALRCCKSSWDDWRDTSAVTGTQPANAPVAEWTPDEPMAYQRHADSGAGLGLHAGGVVLVISSSFLSAFNGMQQRAAQLAASIGKLGYAVHFVALGTLNSTDDCASAVPRVICHVAGDTATQYNGFLKWARQSRATPAFIVLGFTSLTLEVSRAVLRLPKSSLGAWRDGKYDPVHVRKAHLCAQLLDQSIADFPTAATVVFTDDIHFQRTQHVLALAGHSGPPSPTHARVLSIAKDFELRTYSKARLIVLISEEDERILTGAMPSRPAAAILPFGATPVADIEVVPISKRVRGRLLYVGTCHPVARASVTWLVRMVLPRIARAAGEAGQESPLQLRIAGNGWAHLANEAPFTEWVQRGTVVMLGKLSDEQLLAEYQSSRLFVSPLLNATGIATKNFHAMANGLPVLTTRMGAAGLILPSSPTELCCPALSSGSALCPAGEAFTAVLGSGTPLPPRRPTLLEDCREHAKRMECAALAAARANSPGGGAPTLQRGSNQRSKTRQAVTGASRKLLNIRTSADQRQSIKRFGGLHRSGAMLVAETPKLFAEAAIHALSDDILWQSVSNHALRHQRLLSPALQSSVLARNLAGGEVQLRLPAERACVVVCDRCDGDKERRKLLRAVLAPLLNLRIACHVLLLPQATQPEAEVRVLGWMQSEGVFFYSGTAREQWTALLAASPHPPTTFAVIIPEASSAPASLQLLSCVTHNMPAVLVVPPSGALPSLPFLQASAVVLARDAARQQELTRVFAGRVSLMPEDASGWSKVIVQALQSERLAAR